MNSREMVLAALNGEDTPRPVCGPLAVHFCACNQGVPLRDYTLDAKVMADCVIRYYEQYKPDAVWLSADTWITAEAMGAAVRFPDGDEPMCGDPDPTYTTMEELERIPEPDPTTQGREPVMLEALDRIRASLGDEVFIVACFDQSPFSLACAIGGINEVMMATIGNPDYVKALLECCTNYVQSYAKALADHGADMLSTGDSPAVMLGPNYYVEYALPYEKRVFKYLHENTKAKLSLHICGDSTEIVSDMATSGADVLELDSEVDIAYACRTVPEDVAIWGNLNAVSLLFQGNPEQVKAEARRVLGVVKDAGRKRFVLSSGCTLAPATPDANVHAIVEVAKGI